MPRISVFMCNKDKIENVSKKNNMNINLSKPLQMRKQEIKSKSLFLLACIIFDQNM